ncbi:basic leucine zipper transcriptional factor ATF-like 3 isoform X2 [Protopterus annectens]|uniref:basic leucine zipper transcriptional factor ATF-like 3 isoform X2 n=1 Tax=Protopterus annectens TaxID=7888 RepID=UPI001CFA130C|nr:basic leucine zipper transcriptional factor ATF-like 3 isoform X2 [Protopterus annectens]
MMQTTLHKSPEEDKKLRRREKNRVAAQRSRKKQTQKADKLHEISVTQPPGRGPVPFRGALGTRPSGKEYENLEQENSSLKKEIRILTDEVKHLSDVLKDHEQICPLLHCPLSCLSVPRADVITSCPPR